MPRKGCINPYIRDERGNVIPWKIRNRDLANAARRQRMALRKAKDPISEKKLRRKWFIKMKFGLTPEEREQMIIAQNYKCEICSREILNIDSPIWSIDHCHDGNYLRSMLCKPCNSALGLFKDNPEILRKAADYIEKWRTMNHSKTAEKHDLLPNQKQAPQTVGVSGPGPFKGTRAGEKRAGSTKYVDYPGQPEGNMNYKGAVGDCK